MVRVADNIGPGAAAYPCPQGFIKTTQPVLFHYFTLDLTFLPPGFYKDDTTSPSSLLLLKPFKGSLTEVFYDDGGN